MLPVTSAMSRELMRIFAHMLRISAVAAKPCSRTSAKKSATVRSWSL